MRKVDLYPFYVVAIAFSLGFFLFEILIINPSFLPYLAISKKSLSSPYYWHTLVTGGLIHKSLSHFFTNLMIFSFLIFSFPIKKSRLSLKKILFFLNISHSSSLSLFLQGSHSYLVIYGSSGIICGLSTYLLNLRIKTFQMMWQKKILSLVIKVVFIFSLLDITFFHIQNLSSLSHILGFSWGFMLSYILCPKGDYSR